MRTLRVLSPYIQNLLPTIPLYPPAPKGLDVEKALFIYSRERNDYQV